MKNFFYTILIFYIILNISGASIAYNRDVFFIVSAIYVGLSIFIYKTKFDKKFMLLVIVWFLINIFSFTYFNISLPFFRIIINSVNLLFLPYVIIKNIQDEFWKKFESIIFKLTVISLFLFVLNVIFSDFFNGLHPFFKRFTTEGYLENKNYWSAFIYTNSLEDSFMKLFRNSGFMWEPGAFAMMLIWGLCFHWLTSDKMKFDNRAIIYIIAILTTFSTAGYIALVVMISAFYMKKMSFFNLSFLIIFLTVSFYYYDKMEFISNKMDVYIERFEDDPTGRSGSLGKKVNRFQGGVAAIIRSFEYPLGYGLISADDRNDYSYSYGVNGLASLLEIWGFFVFPILLFLLRKCLILYGVKKNIITINLMFIGILVMFFSNPISRNVFFYLLVVSPFCYIKKNNDINEENELSIDTFSDECNLNNNK